MSKSFKYFRIQFGSNAEHMKSNNKDTPTYKYSVYMQSKDNAWLNRNMKGYDELDESNEQERLDD
jgi:hypothetical protein